MQKSIPEIHSLLSFKGVIALLLISAIAPTTLLLAPAIASQLATITNANFEDLFY